MLRIAAGVESSGSNSEGISVEGEKIDTNLHAPRHTAVPSWRDFFSLTTADALEVFWYIGKRQQLAAVSYIPTTRNGTIKLLYDKVTPKRRVAGGGEVRIVESYPLRHRTPHHIGHAVNPPRTSRGLRSISHVTLPTSVGIAV